MKYKLLQVLLGVTFFVLLGVALASCYTKSAESPIPVAVVHTSGPTCYEGPIKVTTLHEINAAEVRARVNLFDSESENANVDRKSYSATLRRWAAQLEDEQTKACYTFWLDRAEEGNLTPASIERIPRP